MTLEYLYMIGTKR